MPGLFGFLGYRVLSVHLSVSDPVVWVCGFVICYLSSALMCNVLLFISLHCVISHPFLCSPMSYQSCLSPCVYSLHAPCCLCQWSVPMSVPVSPYGVPGLSFLVSFLICTLRLICTLFSTLRTSCWICYAFVLWFSLVFIFAFACVVLLPFFWIVLTLSFFYI